MLLALGPDEIRRLVMRFHRAAALNALTSLLALPFILLFIVAGLCVATTGPTFFPGALPPEPTFLPEEAPPNDGPTPAPFHFATERGGV